MVEKNIKDSNETKSPSKIKKIILFCLLIIILFLGYARFIGTSGLEVKEYAIKSSELPSSFDGLKIVHLSDIHYGTTINQKRLENIVLEVNSLKPDIIVFTGDLYDETIEITDNIRKEITSTLSKLDSKLGAYAVSGNHDYSNSLYNTIIEESGFIRLDSNSKIIYNQGEEPIEIVGYPSIREDNPNYDYALSDYYKIALIHEPDAITYLLDKNIDLVLAGHSHGGQVRIPFIGAIVRPEGCIKYPDSYYDFDNTKLYVSYGLGTSGVKLRFLARPSINLYRFYKVD